MLTPDITIMSVGTEITYGKSMVPDHGWVDVLNLKWDRNVVIEEASKFSELKPQVFVLPWICTTSLSYLNLLVKGRIY